MTNLKKSGMGLTIAAGSVESAVAFVAYFIIYFALRQTLTAMVLLLGGLLGGVLAIIGGSLVKSTRNAGGIISVVAAGLMLFATLFMIIQNATEKGLGDAGMIMLPFFILPNALAIAGAIMVMIPAKDTVEEPAPAAPAEEKK